MTARRFYLNRLEDDSGVSGPGHVAEGCLFSNGRVAVTFLVVPFSMLWYLSVPEMLSVHGHGGKTQLVWTD
jgi:hypothetical protein